MIKISSFEPALFNRNADQGNIRVLTKQLEWRGVSYSLVQPFDKDADFVLIGDAYNAVIREYQQELMELVPSLQRRLDLGLPTLLVGSVYEFYLGVLVGLPAASKGSRQSEFREVSNGEISAFGYRNSELIELDLFVRGAFMGTTLYGPVLAKSPDLLDLVLRSLGVENKLPEVVEKRLEGYLFEVKKASNAG